MKASLAACRVVLLTGFASALVTTLATAQEPPYVPMSGCGEPPGLTALERIDGVNAAVDRYDEFGLKALVLRYPKRGESEIERLAGNVRMARHVEHWLYFQASVGAMADKMERAVAAANEREGRPPLEVTICQLTPPGDVPLYRQLVAVVRGDGAPRPVSQERFFPVSRTVLPAKGAARRFGQMEWTLEGPNDGEAESEPAKPRPNSASFYPWLRADAARAVRPGLPVAAVVKAECEPGRTFAVLAIGDPVAMPPRARDEVRRTGRYAGRLTMSVRELLAVTAHHGASGEPDDRAAVQASVDGRDYWCPTKREFCFKYVRDGAFRTSIKRGQRVPAEAGGLYSLEEGLVSLFAAVAQDRCPATIGRTAATAPSKRNDIRASARPRTKGK